MECLRKNEGRHGVLPGLWLPVEAVITDEHLFKFFDRLNQEWQHKVENGENDGQDENENEFVFIDNYERAMESLWDEDDNLDKAVFEELMNYLNRPDGIMAMKAGKLEGALKEKEPRGNVYASVSMIRAIEFFLTKDDRFDVYKSHGFEVTATSKESMDDAGVATLGGRTKHYVKMVGAPTMDGRFFIQPGNPDRPITGGMTLVVYMDENMEKLDNNSIKVHQIRVDESVFKKETEKPKYKPNPDDTAALEAVLESATGYEDAKNGEAMANALERGFSNAFIKAKFDEKQDDHNN